MIKMLIGFVRRDDIVTHGGPPLMRCHTSSSMVARQGGPGRTDGAFWAYAQKLDKIDLVALTTQRG